MATKYSAIAAVNRWRRFWQAGNLPNNTAEKTIYYSKVSMYLNSLPVRDRDFAFGAFLFEMSVLNATDLNNLQRNLPTGQKDIRVPRNARVNSKQIASRIKRIYNEKPDIEILSSVFADKPDVWEAVLVANQIAYDSEQIIAFAQENGDMQATISGWEDAKDLEEIALHQKYPKINFALLEKKIEDQLNVKLNKKQNNYLKVDGSQNPRRV